MLFGEWAVLKGTPAVMTTLNVPMTCKLEATNDSIHSFDNGETNTSSEDSFFHWNSKFIQKFTETLGIDPKQNFKFSWKRDWKLNEGLGSSSASFLTAFFCCLDFLKSESVVKSEELWKKIFSIFQSISSGSGADLAAQFWGKSIVFQDGASQGVNLDPPKELLLIHTGQKACTQSLIQEIKDSEIPSAEIAKATLEFLDTRDWVKAMDLHFEAINKMGLIPEEALQFRNRLKKLNLIESLKTTGAGGGDALLCLINPSKKEAFEREVYQSGYWINSATFEAQGASIL